MTREERKTAITGPTRKGKTRTEKARIKGEVEKTACLAASWGKKSKAGREADRPCKRTRQDQPTPNGSQRKKLPYTKKGRKKRGIKRKGGKKKNDAP